MSTQPPGRSQSRRRRIFIPILILFLLCSLLAAVAIRIGMNNAPSNSVMVTYRVNTTNGSSHVQYTLANGNDTELTQVKTPWETRIRFTEWMDIYLIAGNDAESGKVTCEIYVDGVIKDRQEAKYPDNDKVGCSVILP